MSNLAKRAGSRVASRASRPAAGAEPRRAHGVDAVKKGDALRRLRRIEGQVRGLQRMVEDERYCADVLDQIASVQQALSGAAKILLRNHLEHCITDALRSGDSRRAAEAYDELIGLVYRYTAGPGAAAHAAGSGGAQAVSEPPAESPAPSGRRSPRSGRAQ